MPKTRVVVRDHSTKQVVRRGYYPKISSLLIKEPILYTHGQTNPRFISSEKVHTNVPKVDNPYKKVARTISNLDGVIEVTLEQDCYIVRLRTGYDWSEVEDAVLKAIGEGLELGGVQRMDFASWRANNGTVSPPRPRGKTTKAKSVKTKPSPANLTAPKAAAALKSEGFSVVEPTKKVRALKGSASPPVIDGVPIVKSVTTKEPQGPKPVRASRAKPSEVSAPPAN